MPSWAQGHRIRSQKIRDSTDGGSHISNPQSLGVSAAVFLLWDRGYRPWEEGEGCWRHILWLSRKILSKQLGPGRAAPALSSPIYLTVQIFREQTSFQWLLWTPVCCSPLPPKGPLDAYPGSPGDTQSCPVPSHSRNLSQNCSCPPPFPIRSLTWGSSTAKGSEKPLLCQ